MDTATSDTFVSVIAPLSNDAEILRDFVTEVSTVLRPRYANYEVVLVDDGSTDQTASVLKDLLAELDCLRVVRLSRRFGRDSAILAGMESCIGDYIVIIMPESDPPSLIPELITRCRAGAGVIVGKPANAPPQPWWAEFTSRLFHAYSRRVLRVEMQKGARSYFCLSRTALNAILAVRSRVWHLRYLAGIIGFDTSTVEYKQISRSGKQPQRHFTEDVTDAIGIVLSNTKHPLRIVSALGLVASSVNLLYMVYIVLVYLLKPDVAAGWTTLSMQTTVMFFLLFVILTVLSEYVALALEESQRRPAYFVAAEMNSNVVLRDQERRNIVTDSK
jgi:glycosyltransferase involved in cell wall biosynthesis